MFNMAPTIPMMYSATNIELSIVKIMVTRRAMSIDGDIAVMFDMLFF